MSPESPASSDGAADGSIELVEGGPTPHLRLTGVIDKSVVRAFRLQVRPAAWPARVDLSEATSMDAAGIELLVHLARKQKRTGGELEVVEPPAPVLRLMEQNGLTRVSHWVPAGADPTPAPSGPPLGSAARA